MIDMSRRSGILTPDGPCKRFHEARICSIVLHALHVYNLSALLIRIVQIGIVLVPNYQVSVTANEVMAQDRFYSLISEKSQYLCRLPSNALYSDCRSSSDSWTTLRFSVILDGVTDLGSTECPSCFSSAREA